MRIPFFKKNKKETAQFIIAFCDAPDLSTKFGSYDCIFETFHKADFIIRMCWSHAQKVKEGCYKIDSAYLIIEKIN